MWLCSETFVYNFKHADRLSIVLSFSAEVFQCHWWFAAIIVYDCCLVRPFLNEEDYKNTEQIVCEFEQGIGKELHNQLLRVAQNKQNWV